MTDSADNKAPERRRKRRLYVGVVTSDRMAKTITIRSDRFVEHPQFKKLVRQTTKLKAHDEKGEAKVGDTVEVMECRPLSKTKCFRLTRIIRRGPGRFQAVDGAEGGAQ